MANGRPGRPRKNINTVNEGICEMPKAKPGRPRKIEAALKVAILNLAIIKELDRKIEELKAEREKVYNEKKEEFREIFTMGFNACAEQMSGKIEPDYTVEEIDEPDEQVVIENKHEQEIERDIPVEEEPTELDQEEQVDEPELEPAVEKPKEVEDYSTPGDEKDIVDSVAYCRVCKKRCVPYDSNTMMDLLKGTLEPGVCTGDSEIKSIVEKNLNFLGKRQACVEIEPAERKLLQHLLQLSYDIDPNSYVLENNITSDMFVATADKLAKAVRMATSGVVELQWYSTSSDGGDYSQFEDLRLRLVFVKRIYTMFDRNLIEKRYRKIIDTVDHYKED